MQIFSCPFCGPRPETEFHFGGEAGNDRPGGGASVSAADWAAYLHLRDNPKGTAREIWMHTTCLEVFVMERDTLTMRAQPGHALGSHG
ncbi:sarcosine oxidase subunit delta [Rhodobacter sp. NTK016B]|uniref:sarcosine oxidase subunit delta n=1 Tax=Rhodobacter sp. NTK016B TaxID=2759676 RepID=UPI001A8CA48E|nr:sarcosine oxidase subunit delta [Rhodobacter sp. NTK016B]MBN8291809.1 sarcosine oxidase subunit delta [Rhodobacter sp. NTK016B]